MSSNTIKIIVGSYRPELVCTEIKQIDQSGYISHWSYSNGVHIGIGTNINTLMFNLFGAPFNIKDSKRAR